MIDAQHQQLEIAELPEASESQEDALRQQAILQIQRRYRGKAAQNHAKMKIMLAEMRKSAEQRANVDRRKAIQAQRRRQPPLSERISHAEHERVPSDCERSVSPKGLASIDDCMTEHACAAAEAATQTDPEAELASWQTEFCQPAQDHRPSEQTDSQLQQGPLSPQGLTQARRSSKSLAVEQRLARLERQLMAKASDIAIPWTAVTASKIKASKPRAESCRLGERHAVATRVKIGVYAAAVAKRWDINQQDLKTWATRKGIDSELSMADVVEYRHEASR